MMDIICPSCSATLLTVQEDNVSGSTSHCGLTLFFSNTNVWVETFDPSTVAYDTTKSLAEREAALRKMIQRLRMKAQEATAYLTPMNEARILLREIMGQHEKAAVVQSAGIKAMKKPAASQELKLWVKQCQMYARVLYTQGTLILETDETIDDRIKAMRSVKKCARFIKKHTEFDIPKFAHPFTQLR